MTPHFPQRAPIDAFGRSGFRFAHLSHQGSLLIAPSGMYSWTVASAAAMTAADFDLLFEQHADLDWVLIGTGDEMRKPPPCVLQAFAERKLAFEYMSTASAVRTYNVVLAEGRRIGAGLIAVQSGHG